MNELMLHHGLAWPAQELLGALTRRRQPHAFLRDLATWPLRSSPLGLRFHLRDLLGSGVLVRVATPAGEILRVAKRGT